MPTSYTPDGEPPKCSPRAFTFSERHVDYLPSGLHDWLREDESEENRLRAIVGYQCMTCITTYSSVVEMEEEMEVPEPRDLDEAVVILERRLKKCEWVLPPPKKNRRCNATSDLYVWEPLAPSPNTVARRAERLERNEAAVRDLYDRWPHQAQPSWSDLEALTVPDTPTIEESSKMSESTEKPTARVDPRSVTGVVEMDLDDLLYCNESPSALDSDYSPPIPPSPVRLPVRLREAEGGEEPIVISSYDSDVEPSSSSDSSEGEDDCVTVALYEVEQDKRRLKRAAHERLYQARRRLEEARRETEKWEKAVADAEVERTEAKLACLRHELRVERKRREKKEKRLSRLGRVTFKRL